MTRFAVVAVILAAAPQVAAADCAVWGLVPKVLTPQGAVVAADGGIVVAAQPEAHGKLDPGDVAVQTSWRLHIGNDTLKPPIDVIAPGLAVYRVAVANAFKVELTDGSAVVASVKPSRSHGDPPAAPNVKRIWFEPNHSRHGDAFVGVELAEAAPADTVAIVLADAQGKPRSWGAISGTTLYPYKQAGCMALPNGSVASKAGDQVTLFFVDAAGRVSAATKPIAIAK